MQPGPRYRLVVRRGPQPNQQYELNRDTVTIGRDITNDIVINDPEVSRHHARLIRTATGYTMEDLRSTNGTFINRQRLTAPYQLANGDLIGLGETVTLAYETVGAEQQPTVISSGVPAPPVYAPPPPAAPYVAPQPVPAAPQPVYEEETEPDRNRWIIIGCAALTLVFCCALVAAAIAIDQLNLYCDIPLMNTLEFFCVP
jgi:hypothetical protein